MPIQVLRMEQSHFDAVRRHGEATYPQECCGVLLGHASEDANVVVEVVGAENTRTDSAHNRYNIAPQELIRIQREARKHGLDIVGFYHSHPDHPAQWSTTDLAEAHWIGCSYVITSVVGEGSVDGKSRERCRARDTNSFLLTGTDEDAKRLEPQAIEIVAPIPGTHTETLAPIIPN